MGENGANGMSEPKTDNESSTNPAENISPAKGGEANPSAASGEASPPQLTKEEQWALFEEELKESDWGHQPC